MDTLHIRDFKAETTIGVNDWEKAILQVVRLDIDLKIDCQTIAKQDDIKDAVDYDLLCQNLAEYLGATKTELIETLAEKIASYLRENFGINGLKLSLYKDGAVRQAKTVGVTIERQYA